MRKLNDRVDLVAAAHDPAQLSPAKHSSKALSVLSYIGQLVGPPLLVSAMERVALNRVLHLATKAASIGTSHDIPKLLGHKLVPLQPYLIACRFRVAHCTLNDIDA